MFEVLEGGLLSTIQAAGRRARALGLPATGAADPLARRLANALVGNAADAAGLEITLLGPALRFEQDAIISLCGAEFEAELDGQRLTLYQARQVRSGQVLRVRGASRGLRGFLAVRGGLLGDEVLGSVSTDLRGGFGGQQGRALRPGDRVAWSTANTISRVRTPPRSIIFAPLRTPLDTPQALRVMPTAESTPELLQALRRTLTVSPQVDRMGVRLTEALPAKAAPSRPSLPTVPGLVQLPPDGRPIILLPDAGTHGGYPAPLVVIAADLPRLAQLRPGDQVTLTVVDEAIAHQAIQEQERRIRLAEAALQWDYAQREARAR